MERTPSQKVFADIGEIASLEGSPEAVSESSYASPAVLVEGEVTGLRSEEGKHFKLSDGSFLSVSYGSAVHYLDTEGAWQDINNSLHLDKDGQYYSTQDNGGRSFSLSSDLSSGKLTSVYFGDTSVSLGLLTGYNEDAVLEIKEKETEKPGAEENGWTMEDLIPEDLDTKALYKDVYPEVDIEYTLHGFDLKEQIVLKEKQDISSFDFLLTLEGLTTEILENGNIVLCDGEGAPVCRIPAAFMEDAAGSISYDISYEISETEGGIVLSIVCDSEWLGSSDREYPVIIDPTLLSEATNNTYTSSSGIYTTYTLSYYPDQGIAQWGMPQHLFIGFEPSSGHTRGYIHFHNLPSIPNGAEVVSAYYKIHLFNPYWDGWNGYMGNASQLPLEIREVTSGKPSGYSNYYDWFTYLKWNDQSSMTYGSVLDFRIADYGSTGEWIEWEITGLAKKWYKEGTENRTVAIIPANESSQNSSNYSCIRSLAYGDTYPPTLVVAYRNTDGIEPYYTYNTLDTGHAGTAYIADRTGQLKVAKTLVSYYSTVNPVSIGLVYNSDYFQDQSQDYLPYGPSMDFGSGWTLDIVQKLESVTIGSTQYLKYTDGDGTQHYFRKKSGDNTYFYDEDGLGLKIRSVSGNYEMSDDKNNKRIFNGGYLKQIIDHNGNEISIAYTNGRVTSVTQTNNGTSVTGITVASFTYTGDRLTSIQDAAGITTTLTYDSGKLIGITKGNTQIAEYGYTGQRISKLTDKEALYSLNFTYDTSGKVSSYHESAWDDTLSVPAEVTGAWVSVSYPDHLLMCDKEVIEV